MAEQNYNYDLLGLNNNQSDGNGTPEQSQNKEGTQEQAIDLNKKVRLKDGTEITLEELQNGYLRQSDYTKKMQEIAEMREWVPVIDILKNDQDLQKKILDDIENRYINQDNTNEKTNSNDEDLAVKVWEMQIDRDLERLKSKVDITPEEESQILDILLQKPDDFTVEEAYVLMNKDKVFEANKRQKIANNGKPTGIPTASSPQNNISKKRVSQMSYLEQREAMRDALRRTGILGGSR